MGLVHPLLKNMEYPRIDIVRGCHVKEVRVHVWTVNREMDIERMRQMGWMR